MSEPFEIKRGVVQGDIVSPLCFIIALQAIFLQCDDDPRHGIVLQPGTPQAVRVKSMKYADDVGLLSYTTKESSDRITAIDNASYSLGTLKAHKVKSEHMPIMAAGVFDTAVSETDIKEANFEHVCPHCSRSFSSRHGLSIHVARWCREAEREEYVNDFEVQSILDARGPADNRFFLVKWKGRNTSTKTIHGTLPNRRWQNTWEPARYLDGAQASVDAYWESSPHNLTDNIASPLESRCEHCNKFCKNAKGLKVHTRRCKSVPGSRTGQKSIEQVLRKRREETWTRLDLVEMNNTALPNCYRFPYLGILFTGDGDSKMNFESRRARAATRFFQLSDVWSDVNLCDHTKINLYRSLVVSTFTYGHEAWLLDQTLLRQVNGFNARCLSKITKREIREEARDPTFDLCLFLRSQRLSFLGHLLRADESNMVRQVIMARGTLHRNGDLFMDAPDHSSIAELTAIATDRDQWRELVKTIAGEGSHNTERASTAAETQEQIDALPSDSLLAYTDGGCDGNGARGIWGKAGWGVWICSKRRTPLADMWGPVVIDPHDKFFCNCAIASNNTGELCGMLNALLWAKRQGGDEPFAICYDSKYAKNITTGIWKPRKNISIGHLCNRLFREEQQRREGGVHFIHVKGHSGDDGNDHADDRVQWGKSEGPYCRFALDGSYEGDPDSCLSSHGSSLSSQDSGPGLLDVIGCGDIGNVILDECGVIDLAKLSIACKASKETVQQYNCRTKRIFPVRCGGRDHEYYTFWKEYDKERTARALSEHSISMRSAHSAQIYLATLQGTLDTDTLPRNDTPTNEASQMDTTGNSSTSSPSPSKRLQSRASSTLSPITSTRSKRPTSHTLPSQLRPRRIDFNVNNPSPSTPSTSSSIFIRGGTGPSIATPSTSTYLARALRSNSRGTNRSHRYNTRSKSINAG